jgi:hypothetical protein
VMHETTRFTSTLALRHAISEIQSQPHHALTSVWCCILQYFLAVLVSSAVVRPLAPISEHPW